MKNSSPSDKRFLYPLFCYFRETAKAISLISERGNNILGQQYDKMNLNQETVLTSFLDSSVAPKKLNPPLQLLYPFGLNQSQKTAVENAFSSQISIIQGPPGTGKTQTILNIVANAIRNQCSVAVVSNNNSATKNVAEKLEKNQLGFLTAFLGSFDNQNHFLENQPPYPDMSDWNIDSREKKKEEEIISRLSDELSKMLTKKNRIAEISQEILQLTPEQHDFETYYAMQTETGRHTTIQLSSDKALRILAEYENVKKEKDSIGFFQKIILFFRYGSSILSLFQSEAEFVIPFLQRQFYTAKFEELKKEKEKLEGELKQYDFEEKMKELSALSFRIIKAELSERYHNGTGPRRKFGSKDFLYRGKEFCQEYPVILSTTYSVKKIFPPSHVYDYVIVDESSQVDLATAVLAFSCAKNLVLVGDSKQLPNVLTREAIVKADAVWKKYEEYNISGIYQFSKHNLLSSAIARWPDAPSVLLREHYRCHPKIIGFCNQKFYHNDLIVMTEDKGESDALSLYHTPPGNHARGHKNQRQIDVIREEILPKLEQRGYTDIGIITPYREQGVELQRQLGSQYDIATVHKFQGREKDAVILTSVDNAIGNFVDDPNLLNVAVSRAVHSLSVVVSKNAENDHTNYGDLERYILYNNCEVIDSTVFSVFDLLYREYTQKRFQFLKQHKRVSEFDSENLLYTVIETILKKQEFSTIACASHVSLSAIIRDYSRLSGEEIRYAKNPLTHIDFLLFRIMDKSPVLAIEVDGTSFHREGSRQAERDKRKNNILEKYRIPLLRIRTDESGETARIESELRFLLQSP